MHLSWHKLADTKAPACVLLCGSAGFSAPYAHQTPEPDKAPPKNDPIPPEVPQPDPVPIQEPIPHQEPIKALRNGVRTQR